MITQGEMMHQALAGLLNKADDKGHTLNRVTIHTRWNKETGQHVHASATVRVVLDCCVAERDPVPSRNGLGTGADRYVDKVLA